MYSKYFASEVPMEFDEEIHSTEVVRKGKTRTPRKFDDGDISSKKRHVNGIILSLTKPSYTLKRGIGRKFWSLRHEHRGLLRHLFRQLMMQQNWEEAAGVLSVLLKGTIRDRSAAKARIKYSAIMELLQHMKDVQKSTRKIENVYEIWMKKIGSKSRSVKATVTVELEFILFCLAQDNVTVASQTVSSLKQERDFSSNAISNLVAGVVFCQLWYTAIKKELQLKDFEEHYTPIESEATGSIVKMSIDNSNGYNSVQVQESNSPIECDLNTSIRIDKKGNQEEEVDQQRVVLMEVDDNLHREFPHHSYHSQGLMNSKSGARSDDESIHSGQMPFGSIFHAHDLEPWLFPLRLPRTDEVEKFLSVQGKIHNDHYKDAVKHLQIALHLTPPAFEALLPLIQMLLLGDQVKEAIDEVEKFVQISDAALPLRIKACLLEQFCSNDFTKLWSCLEDTLKKDPTCNHSLTKLISMHYNGCYSAQNLLEMIALHLDATYGEVNTWQEFASCFLKISQCDEDRMSTCMDDSTNGCRQSYTHHFNTIPTMFKDGVSSKKWSLRCRWWLTRHFRQSTLASEVDEVNLELLTYKAASASHLYGPTCDYVVKASTWLEKEENKVMLSILKTHMQNSVGIYKAPQKKL